MSGLRSSSSLRIWSEGSVVAGCPLACTSTVGRRRRPAAGAARRCRAPFCATAPAASAAMAAASSASAAAAPPSSMGSGSTSSPRAKPSPPSVPPEAPPMSGSRSAAAPRLAGVTRMSLMPGSGAAPPDSGVRPGVGPGPANSSSGGTAITSSSITAGMVKGR